MYQNGEPADNFTVAPNWSIEILSPQQSTTRVLDNLSPLFEAWASIRVAPRSRRVLYFVLLPDQVPQVCRGDRPPIVLNGVDLTVTTPKVFDWMKVKR